MSTSAMRKKIADLQEQLLQIKKKNKTLIAETGDATRGKNKIPIPTTGSAISKLRKTVRFTIKKADGSEHVITGVKHVFLKRTTPVSKRQVKKPKIGDKVWFKDPEDKNEYTSGTITNVEVVKFKGDDIKNVRYYYDLKSVVKKNGEGEKIRMSNIYHVPGNHIEIVSENEYQEHFQKPKKENKRYKEMKNVIGVYKGNNNDEGAVVNINPNNKQKSANNNVNKGNNLNSNDEGVVVNINPNSKQKSANNNVNKGDVIMGSGFGSSDSGIPYPLSKGVYVKIKNNNKPEVYHGAEYAIVKKVYELVSSGGIDGENIVKKRSGTSYTSKGQREAGIDKLKKNFHNDPWIIAKMIAKDKFEDMDKIPVQFTTAYAKRYLYTKELQNKINNLTKEIDPSRAKENYYTNLKEKVLEMNIYGRQLPTVTIEDIIDAGGFYKGGGGIKGANEYYNSMINRILENKKLSRSPTSKTKYSISPNRQAKKNTPKKRVSKPTYNITKENLNKYASVIVKNAAKIALAEQITKNPNKEEQKENAKKINQYLKIHNIEKPESKKEIVNSAFQNLNLEGKDDRTIIDDIANYIKDKLTSKESFGRRRRSVMFKKSFQRRR
jgi:hypothetical protein